MPSPYILKTRASRETDVSFVTKTRNRRTYMPQALSSFLVSVGTIIAVVLFIPFVESLIRLLRRASQTKSSGIPAVQGEASKVYSREVA
jgi:hypothetical protein